LARGKSPRRRKGGPPAPKGRGNGTSTTLSLADALRMAVTHQQAGELDEAAKIYGQMLAVAPDNVDANNLLGVIAHQRGQHEEALTLIGRAIAANPNFAQAHSNLGVALQEQGRSAEAADSHRRAIALAPEVGESHHNLAVALRDLGHREDAIASYQRALDLRPDYPEALRGLGNALREEARLEEAKAAFETLVARHPGNAEDHNILGVIQREFCEIDAAIASYRAALALEPDHVEAAHNLGHALLLNGEFEEGWARYEMRFHSKGRTTPQRDYPGPLWDGSPLDGKTILLHCEQGFGDSIQFIRFAKLVTDSYGGRVVGQCQPKLKALFAGIGGFAQCIAAGEDLPPIDAHAPLMSLPHILKTTFDTLPSDIPYLSAAALPVPATLDPCDGLKVGFLWAGSTGNKRTKIRSVEAADYAGLVDIPGTRFYSLQFGGEAADLGPAGLAGKVIDLAPQLGGFAETAALVDQLDLIITIDTYLAHMAGAMGKPVWVMLSHSPDWRWLLAREDSPWYPTARLFRQPARGDWPGAFAKAEEALRALVANR
jgi:Flp pilus assembly protein TadD